jgi:hypothetical protein
MLWDIGQALAPGMLVERSYRLLSLLGHFQEESEQPHNAIENQIGGCFGELIPMTQLLGRLDRRNPRR